MTDTVRAALRWLLSQACPAPGGLAWGSGPCLYDGTAGVVLFLLEAADHLGDEQALDAARAGCGSLVVALNEPGGVGGDGLYTGTAGVAFALGQAAIRTGGDRWGEVARGATAGLERWTPVTDIVSGTAGIGLFLLWAARELAVPDALARATDAGHQLLAAAHRAEGGLAWTKQPGADPVLPNFSHGTAGVAFFLASLAVATGDGCFLAAAQAGAGHLLALADTSNGGCLVPRRQGSPLSYLGWCHGPPGTGRVFYRLWEATGDASWLTWFERTGRSLLAAGIPKQAAPGLWNNRGQCCGHAGVGEYALALHRVTGDVAYLDLAAALTAEIVATSVPAGDGNGTPDGDGGGMAWPDAVHRVDPEAVGFLPGYMQGAAGIGAWLLHHHAVLHGPPQPAPLVLPDSPFGRP
ncbi:MAG TPA: lanthionine synthetase LanC family protein [Acidimicrobiales bacterium]|nr:lanthionine synthetase LanC family protein [Acidimicrobiales bacterium]